MPSRPDIPTLRAAAWAAWRLRSVRRQLQRRPLGDVRLQGPPPLPPSAVRGVVSVLRRLHASCLERSLVLQRWHAAHGDPRDVVIGVTSPADFVAHAWLDGEIDGDPLPYTEVTRLRM